MQVSFLPGSDAVSIYKPSLSPVFRRVEVRSSSVQAFLDWVTSRSSEFPTAQDCRFFYVLSSVHHKSILINVQRDATICSLHFILLQYHSTCFGCRPCPSSGVHKTVVTTTGTSHMVVQLPHSNVANLATLE